MGEPQPNSVVTFHYLPAMNLTVETEHEEDGRWIAEALALRVLADRLEHAQPGPDLVADAGPHRGTHGPDA